MTVTNVQRDVNALTLAITSEFDARVERVWRLWADPRQLERWWGPPGYPATFADHDLTAGGTVTYFMTSPEGEKYHGWWRVVAVDAPHRLEFEDGFADDSGVPNPDLPVTTNVVTLAARDEGGTRMVIQATFPSTEAMQQIIEMGAEEGMVQALGQIEAILAEGPGT